MGVGSEFVNGGGNNSMTASRNSLARIKLSVIYGHPTGLYYSSATANNQVEARVIETYDRDNRLIESMVCEGRFRHEAPRIYRDLHSEMITHGKKAFWELWDYEKSHMKQILGVR